MSGVTQTVQAGKQAGKKSVSPELAEFLHMLKALETQAPVAAVRAS